ncbi:hypothetical protein BT96DRAFT_1026900 [Gymnopus androsaceus JB14]|uniref:Uncharacterized protein n=1 Tax=Gymnopus androsaceus JB14 TaxID=1447944 RepID=A0A6A4GGA0_9AGAR|nr:hypothetical protein BT96DRAFT_1026900 [Gymnopus androsaceus JB14]
MSTPTPRPRNSHSLLTESSLRPDSLLRHSFHRLESKGKSRSEDTHTSVLISTGVLVGLSTWLCIASKDYDDYEEGPGAF